MFSFFRSALKNKSDNLSFWEHIDILRFYLITSILAIIACSIAAFFFKNFLFDVIILGPTRDDFPTYKALCWFGKFLGIDSLCVREFRINFINIELAGQFRYHLLISVVSGIIISCPFIAWQLWLFVRPALYPKELKYGRKMVYYISGLFLTGILFGYYVIVPLSVNFLASYELSPQLVNQITIGSYISIVTVLALSMGIVFELPVFIFFLAKIGLLTPGFLTRNRKYAIVIIFVAAGIITPSSDMFSMILVALPLLALYEIGIIICRRVSEKMKESELG
jgi:sec-independent protein translocase protein TatC